MEAISKSQIIKIHASAKENGIDNVLLHDMVHKMTGKSSTKDLTKFEAMNLIDRIVGKKPTPRTAPNRASESQLQKIKALECDLGWDDNPKRLKAFMKKYAKTEELHWLTYSQAQKLIESLKNVIKNSQVNCQK